MKKLSVLVNSKDSKADADDATTKSLTMPALSIADHALQLGLLYDCRNYNLLTNKTLFNEETIKTKTNKQKTTYTEFEVGISNDFSSRAKLLKIDGSLQIGILSGLFNFGTSGKFLTETKTSKESSKISLVYQKKTHILSLKPDTKCDNHKYLQDKGATHYLSEIQYGANGVFTFEVEHSETTDTQEVSGKISAAFNKIPKVSVGLSAEGSQSTDEKHELENIKCSFHGDFKLDSNPATFSEAITLYQKLGSMLDDPVPISVTMTPLSQVGSTRKRIAWQVKNEINQSFTAKIEKMNDFVSRIEALRSDKISNALPTLAKNEERILDLIQECMAVLKAKVCTVLREDSKGGANKGLSKLLKRWTLIIDNLERVVGDAENLASHLKKLFSQLKTVNICSKEKDVIEKDAEHLYVFAISNIEAKIPSLSQLKKKTKNPKVISIGEFKEEIAMARHFKDFAAATKYTDDLECFAAENFGTFDVVEKNEFSTVIYNNQCNIKKLDLIPEKVKDGFGVQLVPDDDLSDEVKYIGPLKNGERVGYGATFWRNKSSYFGRTIKDKTTGMRKFTGLGVFIYEADSNIDYYKGNWKENLKSGMGSEFYKDGSWYKGEWENNLKNGEGTFFNKTNGEKHIGEFRNGKANGKGKRLDKDEKIIQEGFWKDDVFVEQLTNNVDQKKNI